MEDKSHTKTVNEELAEALSKLTKSIDKDEITIFTNKEAEALREMSLWYMRLKGVAAVGALIGTGLKWLLVISAFSIAFKETLVPWLK